jgi:predicted Ser/Thr protein kinase
VSQTNNSKAAGKMKFIEYKEYKNVEFIAAGGFSKIYKATYRNSQTVILKKLNNSKDITPKELNEVQYAITMLI